MSDADAKPAGGDNLEALKNAAYLVYVEWGPEALVPRAARLAAEFPQVSAATREAWAAEFDEVSREIWRFIERAERDRSLPGRSTRACPRASPSWTKTRSAERGSSPSTTRGTMVTASSPTRRPPPKPPRAG